MVMAFFSKGQYNERNRTIYITQKIGDDPSEVYRIACCYPGFLGILAGYFEINQSRKNVMTLLQNEAETVTAALSISAENAVESYREFEKYIEIHLFTTALLLNHLEREKALSKSRFEKLMQDSGAAKSFYVTDRGVLQKFIYPQNAV